MTIEELRINIDLYSDSKFEYLTSVCGNDRHKFFFIDSETGECYLFDKNGNEDDISKIKTLDEWLIPKDIKKIAIPNNVKSIEYYAFCYRSKLTNVTIPDSVTSIGYGAFYGCNSLTGMTIPNSVMIIRDKAFKDCRGLTSVTIGNCVTSIGMWAFYGCSGLTRVTIPDNVTHIGAWAFYGCIHLKEVIFKGKTKKEVESMDNYPWEIKDESVIKVI